MFISILKWWLVAGGLGLAALPVTRRVFAWLPDGGYAFSRLAGLLIVSYGLWLGASGGLIENSLGGTLLAAALLAAISLWLSGAWPGQAGAGKDARRDAVKAELSFWWARRGHILRVELLFLLALFAWALVRAYAPSKIAFSYGEKYMEFAFLNGILRSTDFPPLDPWLAGYAISYYYFGYVMMAVVTRLAGTAPGVSFDLYDALLFALTACAAYGLVANLVLANRGKAHAAAGFGLLGALFTSGMGNLEGVIHALYSARLLPERFLTWLAVPELLNDPQSGSLYPGHGYFQWFWWRASRVLNDLNLAGEPSGASPITEFPFFSFLLGDNHPHKLALPFVLMAIGLALNLLLRQASQARAEGRLAHVPRISARQIQLPLRPTRWLRPNPARGEIPGGWGAQVRSVLQQAAAGWRSAGLGRWLFYALALGGLGFLNTWDLPIYLGLTVLAYAAGSYWARGRFTRSDLLRALGLGAGLGTACIALYALFYLGFASQASGVLPYIAPPTRLAQFALMFGTFLFAAAFFLASLLAAAGRARGWSLASGLRRLARTWLWITGLSYGPYLLVVALALSVLASGSLDLDPATLEQVQTWMGGLPPGEALWTIVWQRIANPWTYLALSLLIAAGITAMLGGASVVPARRADNQAARGGRMAPAALFAALLAVMGLALALVVEFYYLRDTFGLRMNTVFKFFFQAWVMLASACAFGAWWFWRYALAGRTVRAIMAIGLALLTAAGLVYTGMGITARTHAFSFPPNLDATATLAGDYPEHWAASPDDWQAIQWLNAHVTGTATILEAPHSGSYNLRGRISAFTGLPTLLGWAGHEYQWRGGGETYASRLPDIHTIFTTGDGQQALDLLHSWNVRYVIIGPVERAYIREQCADHCNPRAALEKFDQVLQAVFSQGETTIYQVPVEIH